MVACCFCNCSIRTAVMIVAVISTLHFMVETATVFAIGGDHRLVVSGEAGHVYTIAGSQIFMVVFSILLFAGAFTRIIWFCLPWLVIMILNILYHLYVTIVLLMKTISHFNALNLEMVLLLVLSELALMYMAWLVTVFIQEVRKGRSVEGRDEEDTYPLMDK